MRKFYKKLEEQPEKYLIHKLPNEPQRVCSQPVRFKRY